MQSRHSHSSFIDSSLSKSFKTCYPLAGEAPEARTCAAANRVERVWKRVLGAWRLAPDAWRPRPARARQQTEWRGFGNGCLALGGLAPEVRTCICSRLCALPSSIPSSFLLPPFQSHLLFFSRMKPSQYADIQIALSLFALLRVPSDLACVCSPTCALGLICLPSDLACEQNMLPFGWRGARGPHVRGGQSALNHGGRGGAGQS